MKNLFLVIAVSFVMVAGCNDSDVRKQSVSKYRKIAVDEYVDKVKAGWVGQMAGSVACSSSPRGAE